MIDSHCHLDFEAFDADRQQVLKKAKEAGVDQIIVPGVRKCQWQGLIALCLQQPEENIPRLHFALGLHPYFLENFHPADLRQLARLLDQHRDSVLAVGEIGLDGHLQVDMSFQQRVFAAQLRLAKRFTLPVIIHHRKSHHLIMQCLKESQFALGGVIHAFSGSLEQAKRYIELGFKLGVGGTITYPRAAKTRQTLADVPLSALLLETDAPDMPLMGRQGRRNSPEYLPVVFDVLCSLRAESKELIAKTLEENAKALFRL
ncbi:TatD family hydrolase [Aliiglaciecola sp. CAU 1673]|uniref:TatD family hydrolase n=1 Tax=Aliiglaciecola sp. CAU 1673 TaxID=3032595 RepID=UPI0023DA3634|nr:TatD family hydrolase [Aliiglaciecola sp. CAU 1673]MDF2178003.1 TatD family hydrolase [Aliiglaciecola sp. CAU 1673]